MTVLKGLRAWVTTISTSLRYRQGRSCEGEDGVGAAERERLRQLEEEQDQLSNSLMALTSHFAQVSKGW